MSRSSPETEAIRIAAEIVAAYVSRNVISTTDLPKLIAETFAAIRAIGVAEPPAVVAAKPAPAIPIDKSITAAYLVCLEDGLKFVSLKRHLSMHDMTPGEYRTKWGLPRSYPMVAPNHSAMRSAVAKRIGLGNSAGVARARAARPTG